MWAAEAVGLVGMEEGEAEDFTVAAVGVGRVVVEVVDIREVELVVGAAEAVVAGTTEGRLLVGGQ